MLALVQAVASTDASLQRNYLQTSQDIVAKSLTLIFMHQSYSVLFNEKAGEIAVTGMSSDPSDIIKSVNLGIEYQQLEQQKDDQVASWKQIMNSDQKQADSNNQRRASNIRLAESAYRAMSELIIAARA